MTFAYADPPYLGCCSRYGHEHGASGLCWDEIATHERLIDGLCDVYTDGWALSLSSQSLRVLLPLCPSDVRVSAWVKPFAVYKPNVNPAYTWEPVIWRGGRKRGRDAMTVRDYCSEGITLKRGCVGAKPEGFCFWIFDLLGMQAGDDLVDVFTGSGAVAEAWMRFQRQTRLIS